MLNQRFRGAGSVFKRMSPGSMVKEWGRERGGRKANKSEQVASWVTGA